MNSEERRPKKKPGAYLAKNGRRRPPKKRKSVFFPVVCTLLICAILVCVALLIRRYRTETPASTGGSSLSSDPAGTQDTGGDATGESTDPSTEPPPVTYTEATILSAGDILTHMPQVDYAKAAGNGTYDFTNSFQYVSHVVSQADYAVVNLETTLSGEAAGYSGYPAFNAPDSILDAVKGAGFDMMLFANNHCYDRRLSGLIRTQEQIEEHGLDYIGAKQDPQDDAYAIVDVNGIKVGMLNYADDLSGGNTTTRTINGNLIGSGDLDYMNLYNLSLLDDFYDEVETIVTDMREADVDIIIAYIHWGYEYNLTHNSDQEKVAQALCDRGVDVIIGGHPHVIQDVQVLTDQTGSGHQTLCYYSLGNFVSNQNRLTLGGTMNNQYTEAGLMVNLTLRKYSTGEAMVVSAESIPTFVHRYRAANGFYAHEIVPISEALADPAGFNLTATNFGQTHASELLGLEEQVLGDTVAVFNQSVVLPEGEPAS